MSRTLRRYLSREAKGTEATFHRDSSSAPPPHYPVSFYTLYRSNRETLLAVYIGWRSSICAGWRNALQGAEHLAANRRGRIRRRLIPCCSSAGTLQPPKKNSPNQARRSIARGADSSRCEKRIRKSLTAKNARGWGIARLFPELCGRVARSGATAAF
jgi:hypothetical protein